MVESGAIQPSLSEEVLGDSSYRAITPWALASLALGAVSFVAVFHPVLLIVPILALLSGIVGWRKVVRDSQVWAGKNIAIIGLTLAGFFAATALARHVSRHMELMSLVDGTALEWFGYLAANEPHKAHQMSVAPSKRLPLDDRLWKSYLNSDELNSGLRSFVAQEPVRALLALGQEARVRPYAVIDRQRRPSGDEIQRLFTVTFQENGKPRSYFMELGVSRGREPTTGVVGWQAGGARGPLFPPGFERKSKPAKR